jgi:hypothetical protein
VRVFSVGKKKGTSKLDVIRDASLWLRRKDKPSTRATPSASIV